MTRPPSGPAPSDRELLSAYLTGDLDAETAHALEERLDAEPALAADLDRMAQMLATLQGLSDVDPPAGYEERLQQRLAGERRAPGAAPATGGTAVRRLDTARRRRWPALAAAAALVVVVVGFGALSQLRLMDPQSAQQAAGGDPAGDGDQVTTEAQQDSATTAQDDGAADSSGGAAAPAPEPEGSRDASGDAPSEMPAPDARAPAEAPVILDNEVVLSDEAAVRQRHAGLAETERLLGRTPAQARDTARAYRAALAEAPAFASGGRPEACLDDLEAAADAAGVLVPARVETAVYRGQPALAYVVVTSSAAGEPLDRVVSWLVTPASCQVLDAVVVRSGQG